jgi:ATP-dependent Clp protease adapter protein ClpS
VAKSSNPTLNEPGEAKIKIKLAYKVIVDNPIGGLDPDDINPTDFSDRYK